MEPEANYASVIPLTLTEVSEKIPLRSGCGTRYLQGFKPKYSNISAPVLAILAVPVPLDEQFKKYQPRTADERAAMEQEYAVGEAFTKRTVQDLKAGDPNAQIVTLARSQHVCVPLE